MTDALLARRSLGVRLGLPVVQAVYEALLRPTEGIPTIHVVGTNGKGSTVAMLEHGLARRGLVTGAVTSPHLHRLGERVRRAGRAIDDEALRHAIDEVARVEAGLSLPRSLTFFELLTLGALGWLATQGVDVLIVEAGLGARRDATRVIAATVVAVTSIGLDHEASIGPTLVDIAREKAGALRPGAQAFTVSQTPEVMAVLRAEAQAVGCRLDEVTPWPRGASGPSGLLGAHQRLNAAVALAAGRAVAPGLEAADLDGVSVPGRLERIAAGAGTLCLDVAHNVDGIEAVVAAIEQGVVPRPAVVVFGCHPDKNRAGMLARLQSLGCPLWWVPIPMLEGEGTDAPASPPIERSFERSFGGPDDPALTLAQRGVLDRGQTVLVCGSHVLVGAVRAEAMGRGERDDPQDPRPEPRLSSRV